MKDEKGEPNGILRNAAQLLKGAHRAETFTEQEKLTALQQMLPEICRGRTDERGGSGRWPI